jgi:hypothetical protein
VGGTCGAAAAAHADLEKPTATHKEDSFVDILGRGGAAVETRVGVESDKLLKTLENLRSEICVSFRGVA